eukprot:104148-Prorocentrum_minimum.AAC.1
MIGVAQVLPFVSYQVFLGIFRYLHGGLLGGGEGLQGGRWRGGGCGAHGDRSLQLQHACVLRSGRRRRPVLRRRAPLLRGVQRGSGGGQKGVRRGSGGSQEGVRKGSGGGQEGIYWSSLDARKPQNPTKSEEYQGHLQGVLYNTWMFAESTVNRRKRKIEKASMNEAFFDFAFPPVDGLREHPGFPGASSVCTVLVPWTNPSQEGVRRAFVDQV